MNCRKARYYISAYYDEELSNSVKTELLKHVEICTSCQKELILLEQMRAGLKAFPTDQLSDDFNDKLFARIYNAPRTEATKVSDVPSEFVYRLRWLSPVITAMAVIFIAVFIGYNQFSSPDAPPINYAGTEHQMIDNINQSAPHDPYVSSYPFSASNLSFSAAKLESLQVAASLEGQSPDV